MTLAQQTDLFSAIVSAPFGAVGIRTQGDAVLEIVYLPASYAEKSPEDPVAEKAASQIRRYLQDPDFTFDLPLLTVGTTFQNKVWHVISSIGRGDVMTYGAVAKEIGSAPRAVGQACGSNWYPLVIPCHRVTAASGLGGFSHHGSENDFYSGVKRWLLAHEGVNGYTR
jgi:methylated-DNA-[protein]-cysteine S-methyltransferase